MLNKKTVGVIGASGYTGAELLRILVGHPEFKVALATANSQTGKSVGGLYPHLAAQYEGLLLKSFAEAKEELLSCDILFLALPHGESMAVVPELKDASLIIDLGGDFRLRDVSSYETWYGEAHQCTSQVGEFEYGLPELFREKLNGAKRIANPGCYPTAVALAVAPLLSQSLVTPFVTACCVSGTSGAGKGLKDSLHFSHADDNVYAYKLASHQHTPEIEQTLSTISGSEVKLSFTPHVVPMARGIHATVVCDLAEGINPKSIRDALYSFYDAEPFVRISDAPPSTKMVRGTNLAVIHAEVDIRLNKVIVTCVIDNLVKGAAGQAIQNANRSLGYSEELGLIAAGFYP